MISFFCFFFLRKIFQKPKKMNSKAIKKWEKNCFRLRFFFLRFSTRKSMFLLFNKSLNIYYSSPIVLSILQLTKVLTCNKKITFFFSQFLPVLFFSRFLSSSYLCNLTFTSFFLFSSSSGESFDFLNIK